ncbi:site-specific integrase [uncultured Methanolobus sp.]|uniref:tyrosine-type recombinase/integrase n=1 Tax=uncultured Methanolobus sp. TaxID=218300 RepID=UPI0029C94157|nr:site-specific integrase [uncultured Methanolobus sp.]
MQEATDYLTISEYHSLLGAVEKKYDRLKRKSIRNLQIKERNKLLLQMMWITAGRISDVLSIRTEDIDFHGLTIKFFVKKRNVWHTLSIDSDIALLISNYIRTLKVEGPLFTGFGKDESILTRQYVNQMLEEYSEIAGIRKIHPHLYRHGLAMYLLSQGVPMEVISYRLNHSSTLTTAKFYARITPDIERNIIKQHVTSLMGE